MDKTKKLIPILQPEMKITTLVKNSSQTVEIKNKTNEIHKGISRTKYI